MQTSQTFVQKALLGTGVATDCSTLYSSYATATGVQTITFGTGITGTIALVSSANCLSFMTTTLATIFTSMGAAAISSAGLTAFVNSYATYSDGYMLLTSLTFPSITTT